MARENYVYSEADWLELAALVSSVAASAAHVVWHNNGTSANAVQSALWTVRRFAGESAKAKPAQPSLFGS